MVSRQVRQGETNSINPGQPGTGKDPALEEFLLQTLEDGGGTKALGPERKCKQSLMGEAGNRWQEGEKRSDLV